jgi:hypothetical protein
MKGKKDPSITKAMLMAPRQGRIVPEDEPAPIIGIPLFRLLALDLPNALNDGYPQPDRDYFGIMK